MKKVLIVFLAIFSLLIINKPYLTYTNKLGSFDNIEKEIVNEYEFVENGVKVEYYSVNSLKDEQERIIKLLKDKYNADNKFNDNNIKFCNEKINLDITMYDIDNKTKVQIVIINSDSKISTNNLLNMCKEIMDQKYQDMRYFAFIKERTDVDTKNSIPRSVIKNSKLDTIRSLEINNGNVSNIIMDDNNSINIAQVNYNSGSYVIIGTPTIFITY